MVSVICSSILLLNITTPSLQPQPFFNFKVSQVKMLEQRKTGNKERNNRSGKVENEKKTNKQIHTKKQQQK